MRKTLKRPQGTGPDQARKLYLKEQKQTTKHNPEPYVANAVQIGDAASTLQARNSRSNAVSTMQIAGLRAKALQILCRQGISDIA